MAHAMPWREKDGQQIQHWIHDNSRRLYGTTCGQALNHQRNKEVIAAANEFLVQMSLNPTNLQRLAEPIRLVTIPIKIAFFGHISRHVRVVADRISDYRDRLVTQPVSLSAHTQQRSRRTKGHGISLASAGMTGSSGTPAVTEGTARIPGTSGRTADVPKLSQDSRPMRRAGESRCFDAGDAPSVHDAADLGYDVAAVAADKLQLINKNRGAVIDKLGNAVCKQRIAHGCKYAHIQLPE